MSVSAVCSCARSRSCLTTIALPRPSVPKSSTPAMSSELNATTPKSTGTSRRASTNVVTSDPMRVAA